MQTNNNNKTVIVKRNAYRLYMWVMGLFGFGLGSGLTIYFRQPLIDEGFIVFAGALAVTIVLMILDGTIPYLAVEGDSLTFKRLFGKTLLPVKSIVSLSYLRQAFNDGLIVTYDKPDGTQDKFQCGAGTFSTKDILRLNEAIKEQNQFVTITINDGFKKLMDRNAIVENKAPKTTLKWFLFCSGIFLFWFIITVVFFYFAKAN